MFGVIYIIVGACLLGLSGFRKTVRDIEFKNADSSKFPFYLDSVGHTRWKSNNQIIRSITWNSENHLIITDKNYNDINWTWLEIQGKLNSDANAIVQYGQDIHETDMIPGVRYITKVNGQYKYYVSVRYGKMHYYMDIQTEKIVKPVPECIRYENEAKYNGYEYCTKKEIADGIIKLNNMTTLQRRKYCDYRGIPTVIFDKNRTYRQKLNKEA